MSERDYPDEPAEAFEAPPVVFEDKEGRAIEIRPYEGTDEETEALVEMYGAFDPADRAQGIPPGKEDRIRTWLSNILDEECLNVVAWDGETLEELVGMDLTPSRLKCAELALVAFRQAVADADRADLGTD